MQYFTLSNGQRIPALGFGVYQMTSAEVAVTCRRPSKPATGISTRRTPTSTRSPWARPSASQAFRAKSSL